MKKELWRPTLAILLAALLLLGMSCLLRDVAAENARQEHLQIMRTILPGSTDFVMEPYTGEDSNIRSVHKGETGYVIEAATQGYAGEIVMLIGVNMEGKVTGLVVRDLSETFALGANALNDHEFLAQFLNTSGGVSIATGEDAFSGATDSVSSDSEETVYVDAISGATVTSKAIARCVNSAVAYVTGADTSSGATSWGG